MTEDHADIESDTPATGRLTAPQSPYSLREVGIGFVVLLIGLLVAFGVPIVATL